MDGLGSSFQSEESNFMVAESMEEYVLASAEAAYEYPREQAPMGLLTAGGGFHDWNVSHWWDQKQPSFPIQTFSDNNNWETAAVHMSGAEYSIRKSTGRVNAPMECRG